MLYVNVKGNEFVHATAPTEIYHEIRDSVYSYFRSNWRNRKVLFTSGNGCINKKLFHFNEVIPRKTFFCSNGLIYM